MNGSGTPSSNGSGPFKPVPPPKPKNYRPPVQSGGSSGSGGTTPWENGVSYYVAPNSLFILLIPPFFIRTLVRRVHPTASTILRYPITITASSLLLALPATATCNRRRSNSSSNLHTVAVTETTDRRHPHNRILRPMATMATVTTTTGAVAQDPT